MGIKVTFEGVEFEAASAAEAAELFRHLRGPVGAPPRNTVTVPISAVSIAKPPRGVNPPSEASFPEWVPAATLKFLSAIRDAPPDGADSETMMRTLGISEPKALGGRSANINRLIDAMGFNPNQVYDNKRTGKGRFWKPKRLLPDALAAIEKRLAADK